MAEQNRTPLPGSERTVPTGATLIGPTDPNQPVEVSVMLRNRRELQLDSLQGQILSHEEYAAIYGADPADMDRVRAFAAQFNLSVIEQEHQRVRRIMRLSGAVTDIESAFSVTLNDYDHAGVTCHCRTGVIQIPSDLSDIVVAVVGLDNRPQAKAHFRFRPEAGAVTDAAAPAAAPVPASVSYTPVQVAQLYSFPAGVDGTGQTIGIIELGGGYQDSDIATYFPSIGLTPPNVTSVSVDRGTNSPSNPNSADGEVLLDIEVAGSVAPGANIVVYFTTNTDQGFLDALSTAVHDTANNPCAVSISWGGPESTWTAQAMQAMDQVAQEGVALGVTITVAAGDDGSSDGVNDGQDHVDFPASSPNVLACGGTTLESANGVITSETVWNDGSQGGATGGGFSVQFPQPNYQSGITVPQGQTGRGVPDVAANADPNTGYNILVDGEQGVIGGTSAVAPLWAGLVALLNQQLNKRLGLINSALYALPAPNNGFNDITQGNNGDFSAGPGWDPCTGLGSPIGSQLATLLGAATPPTTTPAPVTTTPAPSTTTPAPTTTTPAPTTTPCPEPPVW